VREKLNIIQKLSPGIAKFLYTIKIKNLKCYQYIYSLRRLECVEL